jgi:hypothetical protein
VRSGAGEMSKQRLALRPEIIRNRRCCTPAAEGFHAKAEPELVDGPDEDGEERARIVRPGASERERHNTSELNAE